MRYLSSMKSDSKGFTLVEIIVTIVYVMNPTVKG
jgi:hypothetical protein